MNETGKTETMKCRMDLYIRTTQMESLKRIQKALGVPMAETVRRAIDEYFERHPDLLKRIA